MHTHATNTCLGNCAFVTNQAFMVNVFFAIFIQAVRFSEKSDPSHYVPGYVWLIHGWYKRFWWTAEVAHDDFVDCTDEQLEELLKNSIAILQIPTSHNTTAPTDVVLVCSCLFYSTYMYVTV